MDFLINNWQLQGRTATTCRAILLARLVSRTPTRWSVTKLINHSSYLNVHLEFSPDFHLSSPPAARCPGFQIKPSWRQSHGEKHTERKNIVSITPPNPPRPPSLPRFVCFLPGGASVSKLSVSSHLFPSPLAITGVATVPHLGMLPSTNPS